MRTRPLGRTGLRVSEMSLGTWGLSGDGYGPVDPADAQRVIAKALDLGFTLFDTADAYGGGTMEALLGKALQGVPAATIVTKVGTDRATEPARKRFDPAYLKVGVARSLKRLGRERLDVCLLHNPSVEALQQGDAVEAMKTLQNEGLVRHWGVAAGDVETAKAALKRGAEVLELAYNLVHSEDLHRLAGEIMVQRVGLLARSTLAYGLLAGSWPKDKSFDEGDHRQHRWTKLELERRIEQIASLGFLVRGDVATLRGAAVRFVLANQLVSSAVLGARTEKQLEELVSETGSGPFYLSDDALSELPRALERVGIAS